MPCVTYLSDCDIRRHARSLDRVQDKDLIELLAQLNAISGQEWSLRKDRYRRRRLFRMPVIRAAYSLYAYVSGPEWQCIHFPTGTNGDGTFDLTRQQMACFLLGYRMAVHDYSRFGPESQAQTDGSRE